MDHEGPDGDYMHTYTLSLTSELHGGGGVFNATTRLLYSRE
jgi:hypothetical protein